MTEIRRRKVPVAWVVTSISLRPEQAKKLDKIAEDKGIARSVLLRTIIDDYLEKL